MPVTEDGDSATRNVTTCVTRFVLDEPERSARAGIFRRAGDAGPGQPAANGG